MKEPIINKFAKLFRINLQKVSARDAFLKIQVKMRELGFVKTYEKTGNTVVLGLSAAIYPKVEAEVLARRSVKKKKTVAA